MAKDLTSLAHESRYPIDAFLFVQRGLDFTVRRIHGNLPPEVPPESPPESPPEESSEAHSELPATEGQGLDQDDFSIGSQAESGGAGQVGKSRHVTGQVLCLGLRDFALEQYGLMARSVLRNWRINHTEDFGNIVFAMVNAGLMQKTEEDSIRDFDGVFDFEEAFSSRILLRE